MVCLVVMAVVSRLVTEVSVSGLVVVVVVSKFSSGGFGQWSSNGCGQ